MARGRAATWCVLTAAVALTLGGCGNDSAERPEGAVQLRENQPTPVDGVRLVAGDISDDSIVLSVDDGGGPAEDVGVAVGETATIKGRSYELLEIHEDTSESAPGGSRSYAWVLPGE